MSAYSDFFLNCKSSVVQLELLEISHPNFTKIYRLVRNATNGVLVKLEDTLQYTFEYCPLRITATNEQDDLDQIFKIQLGDLGEIIPMELAAVANADGFRIKPILKYRTYRSDDLNNILYGPIILEVTSFTFNREGCLFDAKAPSLNIAKTGEIYTLERFPMLRGML